MASPVHPNSPRRSAAARSAEPAAEPAREGPAIDQVLASLERNIGEAALDYSLPSTVEPRIGGEFAAPLWCGCGVVRLRGGLHYRSPGTLRYLGPDPVMRRTFPQESWRTVASLGASLMAEHFGNALRFDVDVRDVFEGPDMSFGVVWRF